MTLEELLDEAYKRGYEDGANRWGYHSDGSMRDLLFEKGFDPEQIVE